MRWWSFDGVLSYYPRMNSNHQRITSVNFKVTNLTIGTRTAGNGILWSAPLSLGPVLRFHVFHRLADNQQLSFILLVQVGWWHRLFLESTRTLGDAKAGVCLCPLAETSPFEQMRVAVCNEQSSVSLSSSSEPTLPTNDSRALVIDDHWWLFCSCLMIVNYINHHYKLSPRHQPSSSCNHHSSLMIYEQSWIGMTNHWSLSRPFLFTPLFASEYWFHRWSLLHHRCKRVIVDW